MSIDFHTKHTRDFAAILNAEGIEVKRVGLQKLSLKANAKRFAQYIKEECRNAQIISSALALLIEGISAANMAPESIRISSFRPRITSRSGKCDAGRGRTTIWE